MENFVDTCQVSLHIFTLLSLDTDMHNILYFHPRHSVRSGVWILAWVPLLCGSSITFFLTLLKFWRTFSSESASLGEKMNFIPPLMTTFYKDGIVFFFLIFSSSLILTSADSATSTTSASVSLYFHPWFVLIYSCSGSRLILNLRRFSVDNLLTTSTSIALNTFRSTNRSEPATLDV